MLTLENVNCPVCGNLFAEGDDVVFCPDCGTPHHRECYRLAGHCVNQGLHASGYNFYDTHTGAEKTAQTDKSEKKEEYVTDFKVSDLAPNERIAEQFRQFEKDVENETFDGIPAHLYIAAIGNNYMRFFRLFLRFRDGARFSWNWAALIFGPYYLLFRKMFAQGIAFLVAQTTVSLLSGYFISVNAPQFTAKMAEIMKNTKGVIPSPDSITAIQSTADYGTVVKISLISAAILLALHIFIALIADRLYFDTVTRWIKSISDSEDDSVTFPVLPGMKVTAQSKLSTDGEKTSFLMRKGGTTMFAPLLAYFVINLIQML